MASRSDKFKALVGIEFEGAEEGIKKLKTQLNKAGLGKELTDEFSAGFDNMLKQVTHLKTELNQAGDENTFRALEVSMSHVVEKAVKVGAALTKATKSRGKIVNVGAVDQQVIALNKLRDGLRQVNVAGTRTTMMSQNMLRVMQDSPFGMLGMANNIQMLGESLSHARKNGESFVGAMGAGLKNLLVGPMAFAALVTVATLIAQKWDVIVDKVTILKEKLEGLSEAQRTLNARMREFQSLKPFEEMITSLDNADLQNISGQLRQETIDVQRNLNTITKSIDEWNEKNAGLSQASKIGGGKAAENNMLVELQKELQNDLDNLDKRSKANQAERDKRSDRDAALTKFGIETAAAKKDRLAKTKDAKKKKDDAKKAFMDAEKLRQARLKLIEDTNKAKLDLERLLAKEEIKLQKEKDDEIEKNRSARMKREADAVRRSIQNVTKGVRAADILAGASTRGVVGNLASNASASAKLANNSQKEFAIKEMLGQKIAARRQAMAELEAVMEQHSGAELSNLKAKHAILMAEGDRFNAEWEQASIDSAARDVQIKHNAMQQNLGFAQNIAGSIGTTFGNMADIMASSTKDGLEKHRGMLKAQAFAEAIAAGVSVYKNVVAAGVGNPLAAAAGAAAMAATITGLNAKIRQMDNPNGASGSLSNGVTGSFTALNQNITNNRAADFQNDQSRLHSVAQASGEQSGKDMVSGINNLANSLQDQKVVMDNSTAAKAARAGADHQSRKVHTTA